jgi:hypothetical protein
LQLTRLLFESLAKLPDLKVKEMNRTRERERERERERDRERERREYFV